jgi:hypothetical protein
MVNLVFAELVLGSLSGCTMANSEQPHFLKKHSAVFPLKKMRNPGQSLGRLPKLLGFPFLILESLAPSLSQLFSTS